MNNIYVIKGPQQKSVSYRAAILVVSILIFISSDSLSKNIFGEYSALFEQLIYVITVTYLLHKFRFQMTSKSNNVILIVFISAIYLTMFINMDVSLGYTVQSLSLITGFVVSKKVDFQTFVSAYVRVVYFIALLSILLFFSFLFFPILLTFFPVSINAVDSSYINLFFYNHFVDMFRNTGIFREPGVYMIYLNIAILFELFFFSQINRKHLFVFILTLLTTLSTGGFLVFSMISIIYLFKNRNIQNYLQFLVFGFLLALMIGLNFEHFESSLTKFDSSSSHFESTTARVASVVIPWNIFIDSPFIGVGLAAFESLYQVYSKQLFGFIMFSGGHSTNTFANALATYGVIYFILMVIGYYKLTGIIFQSSFLRVLVFISFVMMLSNEDIRHSSLFSILLFYGYNFNNKRCLVR